MCLSMSPAGMCTWVGMINEVLDEKYERQMCLAVVFSNRIVALFDEWLFDAVVPVCR